MDRHRLTRVTRRRSVLYGVDQGVSSASNLLMALAVAAITDPAGFGAYALGGSLFALALAAGRMTSSERLMLEPGRERAALVTDSMLLIAGLSTGASIILWGIVGDNVVLAWAAAALPILAQDRVRFVALSCRLTAAIAGDALWLLMVLALWSAVELGHMRSGLGSILVTSIPPLISFLLMVVLVRDELAARIDRDIARSRAEFPYVLDPWVQAGAVFTAFVIAAALGSLEVVGRARALLLVFQPFVSISYVGRLVVLRSDDDAQTRRWPLLAACLCATYSVVTGLSYLLVRRVDIELAELWRFPFLAFLLMAAAQCARAYQQSVADILRRLTPGRLVRARLVFAVVLVGVIGPLVMWQGFVGLTAAWAVGYAVGAVALRPRSDTDPLGHVVAE